MATRKGPVRKTASRAAKAAPRPSRKSAARRARVRMYRVGLGDCFLLTFFTEARPKHMLIDAGMFAGSRLDPSQKEKQLQADVVNDIAAESGGVLDVVVVTHEHMDHVSIFNSAKTIFEDKVKFREAWFGWVEDPGNEEARRLREKYEGLELGLAKTLAGLQGLAKSDPSSYRDLHLGVAGVAEFTGLAADGKIAERPRAAMDFVKKKAGAGNLKFGYPGNIWEFAGVKVYVLGPPPKETQLRTLERAGATYDRAIAALNATTGAGEDHDPGWYPFADHWRRPRHAPAYENAALGDMVTRYYNDQREAWRKIDNQFVDSASDLALQIDKFINNTSLVLAFEFASGEVMLFPGDAQVGNWESWFDIKTFDVEGLLKRTVLYKVGHHGSHNATLKAALEKMTDRRLVAMIPTNQRFAKNSKHWTMPARKLNEALRQATQERILRIDQGQNRVPDPLDVGTWSGVPVQVEVQPLYIDCSL